MDNDKKLNILFGISISAATLYFLNYNNVIKIELINKENNKKDSSIQCNFTKKSIIEIKNSNIQCDLINSKNIDINDEIKQSKIVNEVNNKEIDIIEKDEINETEYNKKFCLLNYIYGYNNN